MPQRYCTDYCAEGTLASSARLSYKDKIENMAAPVTFESVRRTSLVPSNCPNPDSSPNKSKHAINRRIPFDLLPSNFPAFFEIDMSEDGGE